MNATSGRREEFYKENLIKWEAFLNDIFPSSIPANYVWEDQEMIISILEKIGSVEYLNHTFLPNGGGLDLIGATASVEPGCIVLIFQDNNPHLVKPVRLFFHSFGSSYEWAYFRLETGGVEPSDLYSGSGYPPYEYVTELSPGSYVDYGVWERGYLGHDENGYEIPLPKGARFLTRHFEGAFVIFAKSSIYNRLPSTYDARHNRMSDAEFREYISKAVEQLKDEL